MTVSNQAEHDAWNGETGRRWIVDPDQRDRMMYLVADALIDAAALSAGDAVLDIGCGCGATTLAAARGVGPLGSVLGVDISEPMLGVARQRVVDAGHANVTVLQADAQTHRFKFRHDVAISRFGTMFFDDPVAAFSNIAKAIRDGGRLCIATWQPLSANDWLTIPGAALLRYGSIPDSTGAGPGMFAQSDPHVVREVLTAAGYRSIDLRAITAPLLLGANAHEAAAHLADTGVGRAVLDTVAAHDRSRALAAVTEVLSDYTSDNGVQLNAAIWITTAAG